MSLCYTCGEKWTGLNRAHCTGCHKTFNSVGAFGKHRREFKCLDPERLGMKMDEKGIWSTPWPEEAKIRHGRSKNKAA